MLMMIWESPKHFSHPLGFEEPDLEAQSSQSLEILAPF